MTTQHDTHRATAGDCDDDRPAMLAATLTCARCACAATGNGLCADHSRKRRNVIRNSARRAMQHEAYIEHLVTVGGNGRLEVLCDDDLAAPVSVAVREAL